MEEENQAPQHTRMSGISKALERFGIGQTKPDINSELDKRMKLEAQLLKGRGLSQSEYETRLGERREQAEIRLRRDDPRFRGTVQPVEQNGRLVEERLKQYEGGSKVLDPQTAFKSRPSQTLEKIAERRRREEQMPTVEEMTKLSPLEEARKWLEQYVSGNDTGLDAAAERYVKTKYGEDVWESLFGPKSS